MVKNYTLLKKEPGLSQEEFFRYWKERHGPLASNLIPGLRKYIQGHAVSIAGMEPHFDGIAELWFDSIEGVQNYLKWRETEEAKELIEDENKFIDKTQFIRVFAEEQVIVS